MIHLVAKRYSTTTRRPEPKVALWPVTLLAKEPPTAV